MREFFKRPGVWSPQAQVPVRDFAHGWLEIGQFFYLGESPLYPRDPDVTRALHVFDPGLIPAWCRWVFQPPQDDIGTEFVVFGRHAVLRHKWDPHNYHEPIPNLEIPPSYKGPVPNIIERIMDCGGREPTEADSDLPGPYEPWDWSLYYKLRYDYCADHKVLIEAQREKREDRERHLEFLRMEQAYRSRDLRAYAQKILDNVSEAEALRYMRAAGTGRHRPEPRPWVQIKRS